MLDREAATKYIHELLQLMVNSRGSDLFITSDFPPAIKVDGKVTPISQQPLNATQAMSLALKLSIPLLGVVLVVGVLISIVQAVTSIQEQTLSFIPKVLAMAAVLVIGGPWMLNQLMAYTAELWTSIPNMVG